MYFVLLKNLFYYLVSKKSNYVCQEKTSFYCDKMSFFILFILCMTFLTEVKGNEKNVFLAYIIKKNSSHYNMI